MALPLLQLEHVSKRFDAEDGQQTLALEDLCLRVDAGEFVAVLGPSGCGKTTLLKIIAGLLLPTQGQCLYKGRVIVKPSLERGYVFQEARLFPWLTVWENVNLAGKSGDLLKTMKLDEFAHYKPAELSGGMSKRVALARALACRPQLLLLDEPLANLDVGLSESIQGELHQQWRAGMTCIMVTHNIDEALALGTRLIILKGSPGQIAEDMPLDLPFPRKIVPRQLGAVKSQIYHMMGVEG